MAGADVDIMKSIVAALESEDCPIDFSDDEKKDILDLCEKNAFVDNHNKFENEIKTIVDEAVQRKILEDD